MERQSEPGAETMQEAALRHVRDQVAVLKRLRRTVETAERMLAGHVAAARRLGVPDEELATATGLNVWQVRAMTSPGGGIRRFRRRPLSSMPDI